MISYIYVLFVSHFRPKTCTFPSHIHPKRRGVECACACKYGTVCFMIQQYTHGRLLPHNNVLGKFLWIYHIDYEFRIAAAAAVRSPVLAK